LSDIDSDSDDLNSGSVPNDIDPDLATITLCASYINSNHKPSKLTCVIQGVSLMIMIDSGSTHSFINPTIVHNLSLPTITCPLLTVTTASGVSLSTSTLCAGLQFSIQDHSFTTDFRVLHVSGYDIILGID
jgi:Retroviral aspartyl protease